MEQITNLRTTPNMACWRPCDAVESAVAWKAAVERNDGPSALIFSRQGLPHQARDDAQLNNVARGAYTLVDCDGEPDAIIIATGSEVGISVDAAASLAAQGRKGARGFHALRRGICPARFRLIENLYYLPPSLAA